MKIIKQFFKELFCHHESIICHLKDMTTERKMHVKKVCFKCGKIL